METNIACDTPVTVLKALIDAAPNQVNDPHPRSNLLDSMFYATMHPDPETFSLILTLEQ
jgi:hypothetical protein